MKSLFEEQIILEAEHNLKEAGKNSLIYDEFSETLDYIDIHVREKELGKYLDTIKKVIHKDFEYHIYTESDAQLKTKDRKLILPIAKGDKKHEITSAMNLVSKGCWFRIIIGSDKTLIVSSNPRNNRRLPINGYEWIRTSADFKEFIEIILT